MYQKAPERKPVRCRDVPLLFSRDVRQAAHDTAAEHGQKLALENASSRGAAPHRKMAANRLSTLQLSDARAGHPNVAFADDGRPFGHLEARLERARPLRPPVRSARLLLDDLLEKTLEFWALFARGDADVRPYDLGRFLRARRGGQREKKHPHDHDDEPPHRPTIRRGP